MNDIVTNITGALAKMNFNNLLWALLVGVIGYVVVKYIMKAVSKLMKKTPVDPSIRSISLSVIKMVLYFIVATIVADILGLPPTSLVTVLGTMGLAFSPCRTGFPTWRAGCCFCIRRPLRREILSRRRV